MTFQLRILGAGSATPSHGRHQTSQLLTVGSQHYLIDCGEGTQYHLDYYKVKLGKLNNIFISHLHGDHYFGLMPLLNTLHLYGRTEPINIYAPPPLESFISYSLSLSGAVFGYDINFIPLHNDYPLTIFENQFLIVNTIPLDHRLPCTGFLFKEKGKPRRINKDRIPDDISPEELISLKKGNNIYYDDGGLKFKNEDLTFPPKKSRSYAYCSDTMYKPELAGQIDKVDILYHEATFQSDHQERAAETFHSTAEQAAKMAKAAGVNRLLIGHFSSRYKRIEPFLDEAKAIFKNSYIAEEGIVYYEEE